MRTVADGPSSGRTLPLRLVALALAVAAPLQAYAASAPVAEVANIRFHSDELMNLHHFLYAWAWRTRTQGRPLSQRLAAIPSAPFTTEERNTWDGAVAYYDRELASKDLLFGEGMVGIKTALVLGTLDHPAIVPALRATLESALPIYRRHFWPEHDRVNRAWITDISGRVDSLREDVVPRLETLYATKWFAAPQRADIVWAGNWAGGYATSGPTHATISSTHPTTQGWEAVETVFHEYSHILIDGLSRKLNAALGDGVKQHGVLWHVVQFYLTGEAVRVALARRNVTYEPSVVELFGRAWPQYKQLVPAVWAPYFEGRVTMDDAVANTVPALPASK
jgi:hypothetical protein